MRERPRGSKNVRPGRRPHAPRSRRPRAVYRRRRLGALVLLLALCATGWSLLAPSEQPREARKVTYRKVPHSKLTSARSHPASYHIEARYTTTPPTISGRQRVRYVNAEGEPLRHLYFRLWTNEKTYTGRGGGTKISRVEVDGVESRFSVRGTRLEVNLPSPLPAGRMADVSLRFRTRIPEIAAPFGYHSGTSQLGVWYPVLAVYDRGRGGWILPPPTRFGEPYFAEAADYRVSLTLPKDLTVAAAGTTTGKRNEKASKTMTYEAHDVRDFALAIGKDLYSKTGRVGNTTVRVYYRPGYAARADLALDLAERSLGFFSRTFTPYPYRRLTIVDAPLIAGTEFSTITFVNLETTPNYLFDSVIPHEVAHQWWYAQVGSNQFREPWLDESLATYSEWLFSGDAATRFPGQLHPSIPLGSPVNAFPDDATYQRVTYRYGAQTYRALSRKIGEKTLLRGLKTYARRYRYRTATSEDLVRTLSQSAGEDLTPFFAAHGVDTRQGPSPKHEKKR